MPTPRLFGKAHPNYKHGQFGTPLYKKWAAMKRRCFNKNDHAYPRYGGRGITVCKEWLEFKGFSEDMAATYREGMTLERIDNNKGYEPDNCTWIPLSEQSKNRRCVKLYEHKGKSQSIADWARELNVKPDSLRQRLVYWGWPVEDAIETPFRYGHKRPQ